MAAALVRRRQQMDQLLHNLRLQEQEHGTA
jgi:hypothetical protein